MKLKHILIIAFILLTALPLFLSLQYLNQYTSQQYRSQVETKLEALSLIAKKRVEAVVERIIDNNALIKSRTQMRISLKNWLDTQDSASLDKLNKILNDAKTAMPRLRNISVYDPQGNLVTSSVELDKPASLSLPLNRSLPAVRLTRHNQQLLLSSLDRLKLNTQTIGYIKSDYYADFVISLTQDRTGLGETGEWLIAVRNENGDALFAVPLKYDSQAAFQRTVSKEAVKVPITQALLGNEILMSEAPDYVGQPVLASTRYLPWLDWGLVVKINESEISAMIQKTSLVIYILEGVILVLAIIIGFGVSFYISNPLERLIAHTDKVATGHFDPYNENSGLKEIKDLTKHFNFMIAAMKDLNGNLNQKVEQRTKALEEANQKLRELSIRDPLTGLYNRRYLHEILTQILERARRYQEELSLVLIDLDHFKLVNDSRGHDAGDKVLQTVSEYFLSAARQSDVVARFGGEEFCLVLPATDSTAAISLLERIRKGLSDLRFEDGNEIFRITASFGVTHLAEPNETMNELLKKADLALYSAKSQGRNRVVEYDPMQHDNKSK